MRDISKMRQEYTTKGFDFENLAVSPTKQFEKWFEEAVAVDHTEANAFTLATVGKDLKPSQRTVLLKMYDENGFIFFSNYGSKKAQQIDENPNVSIHFAWLELFRQVRIEGTIEKISKAESIKYYLSRPKGSQIGAWASNQSKVVSSRAILENKFSELKNKFLNCEVPYPEFWGGYVIKPTFFEFWQGGHDRLHDRFSYTLQQDNSWKIERLEP